jgi:ABC-type sugar transport system substrate-binding protein
VCLPREFHFFYDQIRDGIFNEANRVKSLSVEVVYSPLEKLGLNEIDAVRRMVAEHVDALIMTPADPAAIGPEIRRAEQEGVRVVCVASDAASSSRSSVI